MNINHLELFSCPNCGSSFTVEDACFEHTKFVSSGHLRCTSCQSDFPIINHIPRFATGISHPAESFGYQWNSFALSQIDTYADTNESFIRLSSETCLSASSVKDHSVLEVGCGAGRFLSVNLSFSPSLLVGLDVTSAVDSVFQHVSPYTENLLLVQADIIRSPFKPNLFDFVYSIGVLHHTPDPYLYFKYSALNVCHNGRLSVSLYENSLAHRTTKNSISLALYDLMWSFNIFRCEIYRSVFSILPVRLQILYCKTVIPVLHFLNKIPFLRFVRYLLPSTCYQKLPLSFSVVDTMDTYATKIVYQYRAKTLYHWFASIGCDYPILHNSRDGWVSVSGVIEFYSADILLASSEPALPHSTF